ncbi:MAG: hypothetical protein HY727_15220 [Candidatus Rokubacteria bacterium]|nr:hypothetical protein [Candidatus Rokubacteria bacterium]
MAVVLLSAIRRYLGVAADVKPTTGVPAGSEFYEADSGATYLYDGAAWALKLDAGPYRASKSLAFTGAANLGAVGNVPLFTVTGEVLIVAFVPFCTVDLAGAGATLALGVTNATALFIAATTATDIDLGEFWVDTTPDPNGVALPAALKDIAITDHIVGTVAVAAITAGTIRWDCYWIPLSSDGKVVAA